MVNQKGEKVLRKLKLQLKKRIEEFNRTSADADTLGFRPIKCHIELNPYSDMLYLQQSIEKICFWPKIIQDFRIKCA
jgi:hypothetical protein